MKRDFTDIHAEMDAIAAMCFLISGPMVSDENCAADRTIGAAIYGIGRFIDRIDEDLAGIELEHLRAERTA